MVRNGREGRSLTGSGRGTAAPAKTSTTDLYQGSAMNILTIAGLTAMLGLAGCSSLQPYPTQRLAADEEPVVTGPSTATCSRAMS